MVRATVRHAYVFPRRGDSDGAALTAQSDGKSKLVKASWPNFIGSRPKMASAAGAWPLGSLRNQAFHSDAACVPAFLPWSRVREARRPEVGSRGRLYRVSAVWTSGEVLRRWWGARRGGGGRCRRWRRVGHVRRHPRRWRRTRLLRPGQYIPLRASRGGAAGHAAQVGVPDHRLARRAHTSTRVPDYRIIAEKSSCESVKRAVRVSLREFIRELILDRAAFFVKVCEV